MCVAQTSRSGIIIPTVFTVLYIPFGDITLCAMCYVLYPVVTLHYVLVFMHSLCPLVYKCIHIISQLLFGLGWYVLKTLCDLSNCASAPMRAIYCFKHQLSRKFVFQRSIDLLQHLFTAAFLQHVPPSYLLKDGSSSCPNSSLTCSFSPLHRERRQKNLSES